MGKFGSNIILVSIYLQRIAKKSEPKIGCRFAGRSLPFKFSAGLRRFWVRIFLLSTVMGLSMPGHAMKRAFEEGTDEASPKRQKIERTYHPLPKRQKFIANELIGEIKNEAFYYIEYLMYEFFKKLHVLAWEKNISSLEKKLAWLQTMYAIIYKVYDAAWKVGSDAVYVDPRPCKIALDETRKETTSSELCLAVHKTGQILKMINEEKAFMAENNLALVHDLNIWSDIKSKVQKIVNDQVKNTESKNAYRIAVDEVFKLVLENFEGIFDRTYDFYFKTSLIPMALESQKALNDFLKEHIAGMSPGQISFLAPWLVHLLPFDALSETQRPLCELLWVDTYAYPLLYPLVRPALLLREQGDLPLDMVKIIFNFIMRKLITDELYEK